MAGEISLPFKSLGLATEALTRVPFDSRISVVAIDHGGSYVSINYLDLLPGDVILFDAGKFDPLVLPAIARYQNEVFHDLNVAKWKHVGILDDNLQVWDAMPGLDVRVRPLREILVPLSRICVRRPCVPVPVDELRDSLVRLSSVSTYRFGLDTGRGLASRLRARVDDRVRPTAVESKRVICSVFVSNVLRRATKHPFFRSLPIVLPGDFVVDDQFTTVDLDWCCIDKSVGGGPHVPDMQPSV